jgi:hypothetical protein
VSLLLGFQKGQRKDDVMQARLRIFRKKKHQEGVVFIGVAQEKARVPRTARKAFGNGGTIPWINSKLTAAFRHLETELTNYLAQKKAA